jgi:hypothetical protein
LHRAAAEPGWFSLSLRDVELILAERGIVVSYETVRRWCMKFGATFADRVRRRRPRPGDKWHLDEVFIRIQGVLHYLWRAPSIRMALCSIHVVQPDGMADDLGWEPMTIVGVGWRLHAVSLARRPADCQVRLP